MGKNSTVGKIIAIFFLLSGILIPVWAQENGLVFSITDWDTGELGPGVVAEQSVTVKNFTSDIVSIDLVSTCSCVTTSPESFSLEPAEMGEFIIFFDSSDDKGDFEKLLIIQTDSQAMPKGLFVITGTVNAGSGAGAEAADPGKDAAGGIGGDNIVRYYYTPGCKSCNRFLRDAGIPIDKRDITEAALFEELQQQLEEHGETLREVPVLITEAGIFQGEKEVVAGYNAVVEGVNTAPASEDVDVSVPAGINISVFPVLAAGLLDGVNPCAFTTLIFLLSALSVAGRSRRETLVIGLFFTVTVFVTYYLIGLGFFRIIRIADSFVLVSKIIRWALFAVLVVFAVLSFHDYFKVRAGRASDIILQLPDGVKRRMHSSIRTYSRSAALAGSSMVMGFLISIFELGCTGQIYFPTITYIIQTEKDASGFFFLLLYNIAFILPLVAVFIVVFLGITSKRITRVFQSNLGIIKLLTGFLFIAFAVLMIVL